MDKKKHAVIAWCFYDWANSAFALTVMAGFFPVFYKSFWCIGVDATVSTARLGIGNTIAGLFVAIMSPFLGALADSGSAKKKFLGVFVFIGVIATGMLFYVQQGRWMYALIVFVIANIGFNCANLFYDALLVNVADKKRMDWVSSAGFSLGYLGCGLLFIFNVFMVKKPHLFGLPDAATSVRYSFLITSGWWLLFSIPLFVFVKEPVFSKFRGLWPVITDTFERLRKTTKKVLGTKGLLLFFIAYWFYIDGVHTFVLMAVDFGMSIGLSSSAMMTALIIVQFVAFPAALLFGKLSEKFGAFSLIIAGIFIYILVCGIGTLLLKTDLDYIILAGMTGLAQGGIQALSRSYFGKIVPPSEAAEYFGFYNVVGRFAVIIGPSVVALVALLTRRAGLPSMVASRAGMASVSLLFIVGAILLLFSDRINRRAT